MPNFIKNKDKDYVELLRGSSISLILKVTGMLFGYLVMLFITKNYGAEEWGLYSLCFTILSIAALLPKFGFDNSLVRIISELNTLNDKNEIISVILKALAIATILSFLVIISIQSFSDFLVYGVLNQEELQPYIELLSYAVMPLVILVIISAVFQALKKTMFFMLFQTALINMVFLGLLIIYHYNGLEVNTFRLYFYSICVVLLIAATFLLFHLKGFRSGDSNRAKSYGIKPIINISFPMLLSSSFALMMGWSDILILSYYKSTADIGIYNVSLKLAALSGITLIAINAIATPKFAEFYAKNDINGLKKTVQRSTKMIFTVTTPVLLVLIIFSKSILGFFGSEFIIGYLALIYLCLSRFINAISGSVGYIMQMTDQQRTYQNIIIIAFLINLALNFLLIPEYGVNGAAIASSIAMVFGISP